jgi:RNA polymerase sigma-70 factor (ECF subfamily)
MSVTLPPLAERCCGREAQVTDPDHERFTRLWTATQPIIAGYIAALVPDPHAADDVLQEVAVALLRKFPEYDPLKPFVAWAMGMAKMAILSLQRDRARNAQRFGAATIESLATVYLELQPELDERRVALGACLTSIRGRNRELVQLRYVQGMSPQEIASRMGMAAGAVRVALLRLRTALQFCIERRLAVERQR